MEENLVSVIIPCYNQGKYIDEAIQSVIGSTYTNLEIIVINDGSTDPFTCKLLATKSWDKTIIYNIANGGVANARNFGIRKSKGKYILPLDADDKIAKNYISDAVKILNESPSVKVVCCDVELFGAKRGKYQLPAYSMEMIIGQNTMVVTSLYRRSDYVQTKGYNTRMATGFEDWDFWLTLLEEGGEVFKLNYVGFYYRIRRGSRNHSLTIEQTSTLRKQMYENHKELYSKHFFDPTKAFEYTNIITSKEYLLGKILLFPFRIILNLINKIN